MVLFSSQQKTRRMQTSISSLLPVIMVIAAHLMVQVTFSIKTSHLFSIDTISIHHECECGIEKSVPRIAVWHNEACRVMTTGDLRVGFFYPTLTRIMDYFSCSPVLFYFKISCKKSLNTLRCNFT